MFELIKRIEKLELVGWKNKTKLKQCVCIISTLFIFTVIYMLSLYVATIEFGGIVPVEEFGKYTPIVGAIAPLLLTLILFLFVFNEGISIRFKSKL